MAHGYKTTEFILTAAGLIVGLGLVLKGAELAIEGGRVGPHDLWLVGLALCATGAVLVASLTHSYASSRGQTKAPPSRVFAGRV